MPKHLLFAAASASILIASPALAASDNFDSVLHAISDANAQSYVTLIKGKYRGSHDGTKLTLEVPSDMSSKLKFDIRKRSIRSAEWSFDKPITVTVETGGRCVRLVIRRLRYDEGGVPIAAASDTTMTPLPGGGCNDSEAMLGLADVLSLNQDPNDFFRGMVFSAMGGIARCVDAACAATAAGTPVRSVKFFGSTGSDGQDLPAFAVALREGSTLVLPAQSYVKLAAGSGAQFDTLDYNLVTKTGKGILSKLQIAVDDGVISSGSTKLQLTALSNMSIESMAVSTDPDGFSLERGTISGRLGEGTNIVLAAHQGRVSSLYLLGADVLLAGVSLSVTKGDPKLSVTRGKFAAKLKNADIWLTEMSEVRLDYTNLDFLIGCDDGAPAGCAGVEWTGTTVKVKGKIGEFATNLSGGQFPLSDAGMTQIKSGRIQTGALTIDSENAISPVVGPIKEFDIAFEGQDLHIDGQTKIGAARVELSSRDLAFIPGEVLPTGNLALKGDVTRFEASSIGRVTTIDGQMKMSIRRKAKETPEVVDGEVTAKSRVRLEGNNYADGTLKVTDFRYYQGFGSAKAMLTIDKARYDVTTPGSSKSEDNTLARVTINVRPATIPVTLAKAVVLGPFEVKASHQAWTIDPVLNVPFTLSAAIPHHELVYAPIEEKLTGHTLCAPKVHLSGQTSTITGKVDVRASSSSGKISVHDLGSDGPVQADVDDNGCTEVAALICGAIGGLGGPLGSVALAAICGMKVEDAEAELEGKIRTLSTDEVKKFKYDYSW